jgi:invasion protein IalB
LVFLHNKVNKVKNWVLLVVVFASFTAFNSRASYNGVFGSWSVSCGVQNCAMTQMVAKDASGKEVMLGVSINFALKSDFGIMIVRLPKVVNKEAGLGIKVDEKKAIRLPISECNNTACQTIIKIDQAMIDEFSSGKVAKYAYALRNNRQMILPISLDQFAAAYGELHARHLGSTVVDVPE